MGYAGLGNDTTGTDSNDLWQYNPVANSWSQKASLPAAGREGAACFVIDSNAYVAGGANSSPGAIGELWEYNSITNSWAAKATFPTIARYSAVAFSICGRGYLGTGGYTGTIYNDLWEYTPGTNSWVQKTSPPGPARASAIAFTLGTKGYIGLGTYWVPFLDDLWEYTPDSECTVGLFNPNLATINFNLYPNPARSVCRVAGLEKLYHAEIRMYNSQGRMVLNEGFANDAEIPVASLPKGIYFVEVRDGERRYGGKLVVE